MMKHLGNLFFFSASIVLITLSCNKQQQNLVSNPGNWVQKFQIGGWPRNGASSWVIGDTGYIVAGYNSINDSCLSDLWQFDPNLNRWAQKAYFPGGARQAGVATAEVKDITPYVALATKLHLGIDGGISASNADLLIADLCFRLGWERNALNVVTI